MSMFILMALISLFTPSPVSAAQTTTTCTGGFGNDYGGMTCHIPDCDVIANVSLGCTVPVDPSGNGDAYACYPTTGSAITSLKKFCNSLSPPTATCWKSNIAGMIAWCASPPVGVNTPSEFRTALTDSGDSEALSCRLLQTDFVTQFCKVLTQ